MKLLDEVVQMLFQQVTEKDFRSTFLPAFAACVKAGSYSIMCSYNRLVYYLKTQY